jgi:O-antigen ligase
MPQQVAFCITIALIVWLLAQERMLRRGCSVSLWIPVLWLCIIGSRPVSSWFGLEPTNAYLDGSPLDRFVFLALILAAFVVLHRRKINWMRVVAENKWLFLLLFYLGVSTIWADDSFVSFKRWIKEIGNIAVILIVLSDDDPVSAMKSVLLRCSVFLIPASVLLVKYYPGLGRDFNNWNLAYTYCGVTTDKNTLGMTLFACSMGLSWSLLDLWRKRFEQKKVVFAHLLLLGMALWLYAKANCATSLACTALGVGIIFAMKVPALRNALQRVGLWGLLLLALCALLLNLLFNPMQALVGELGRNMTFTGRTAIWQQVLQVDVNPLVGAGYSSFWQPERSEKLSKALGFYYPLQEAHDGYIEVYLNSGLIGLAILAIFLRDSASRIIRRIRTGDSCEAFRFAVLVGAVFYNITESALSGLLMVWVVLLLAVMRFPSPSGVATDMEFEFDVQSETPKAVLSE